MAYGSQMIHQMLSGLNLTRFHGILLQTPEMEHTPNVPLERGFWFKIQLPKSLPLTQNSSCWATRTGNHPRIMSQASMLLTFSRSENGRMSSKKRAGMPLPHMATIDPGSITPRSALGLMAEAALTKIGVRTKKPPLKQCPQLGQEGTCSTKEVMFALLLLLRIKNEREPFNNLQIFFLSDFFLTECTKQTY